MPAMFGGGGMSAPDVSMLAEQEAALNRNNSYSPIYGGTSWSYGPAPGGAESGTAGGGGYVDGHYVAPNGEQIPNQWGNTVPNSMGGGQVPPNAPGGGMWTETQTLSPYAQQRFDLAQSLMGRVGGEMQGFDPNTTQVTMDPNFEQEQQQQAYKYATSTLDPQWAIQEQQLKGQMAAQGLHPGDPGYAQAMQGFQTQKNAAYDQARSGSYQTGVQAGQTRIATESQAMQSQIARQLAQSGWSLGQINALMAGLPPAPGGSGAQSNLLQAGMQNSQLQQQLQAQAGNNAVGAGAALGAAAISASDVNVKEDFQDATPAIEEFLESAEPSEYRYKPELSSIPGAGEGRYVSPMAQGLERSAIGRSMVMDTPTGKVVDYGKSFGALLGSLSHLNKKLNQVMGL
jgi:hypothetical protein